MLTALLLLFCSTVYKDIRTGREYMFFEMFYDEVAKRALNEGDISIVQILLSEGRSYLWMFCPIIVGVPSIILGKVERLVMFRTSKNKYCFSKYISNLFLSGMILVIAYLLFSVCCAAIANVNCFDIYFVNKLVSVFFWGIYCAIPSIVISEFVENKYLILCIPFVINYFMCTFLGNVLPIK